MRREWSFKLLPHFPLATFKIFFLVLVFYQFDHNTCRDGFALFCLYLFSSCFAELLECVNFSLLSNLGMFQPLFLQIFVLILSLSPCLSDTLITPMLDI